MVLLKRVAAEQVSAVHSSPACARLARFPTRHARARRVKVMELGGKGEDIPGLSMQNERPHHSKATMSRQPARNHDEIGASRISAGCGKALAVCESLR